MNTDHTAWRGKTGLNLTWRRVGKCSNTTAEACVELADTENLILIRDSENPGPTLVLTRRRFTSLVGKLRESR